MKPTTATTVASLAAVAAAAREERAFAVMSFTGTGFMTEGRVDPIISPGTAAGHLHGVMGGSNFGLTVEGDDLLTSNCTNSAITNDLSDYWAPEVFYQDPDNGTFEKVPLSYQRVYYFFEPTIDDIKPFPVGLKMVVGDASTRDPPAVGGALNIDGGSDEPINPVQWHCPRTSYDPPSYPVDSDGTTAGIVDPNQENYGAGFPLYPCDGWYLRQDIHFPSCYNPEAGIDDYKNNMAWPISDGKYQNCPEGYVHVPHIFYELYWDTKEWDEGGRWTPDGKTQPYVLANGDATGYSSHGDFISAWDEDTLAWIIENCDVTGKDSDLMSSCTGVPGGINTDTCTSVSAILEAVDITSLLQSLPGDNEVTGWGKGGSSSSDSDSDSDSDSESDSTSSSSSSTSTTTSAAATTTTTAAAEETYAASIGLEVDNLAAAADTTATGFVGAETAAVTEAAVSTVWEIESVTITTTVTAEPTAEARRLRERGSAHRRHGHRHLHGHYH
ncbi:hypothetical protein F4778DRAFT_774792 [Xylariomycetidae sp. FL2044]|nr:hypothetical protein F4778DRAFT_774792 [Xylariomycetidae sp. FL2044]